MGVTTTDIFIKTQIENYTTAPGQMFLFQSCSCQKSLKYCGKHRRVCHSTKNEYLKWAKVQSDDLTRENIKSTNQPQLFKQFFNELQLLHVFCAFDGKFSFQTSMSDNSFFFIWCFTWLMLITLYTHRLLCLQRRIIKHVEVRRRVVLLPVSTDGGCSTGSRQSHATAGWILTFFCSSVSFFGRSIFPLQSGSELM